MLIGYCNEQSELNGVAIKLGRINKANQDGGELGIQNRANMHTKFNQLKRFPSGMLKVLIPLTKCDPRNMDIALNYKITRTVFAFKNNNAF